MRSLAAALALIFLSTSARAAQDSARAAQGSARGAPDAARAAPECAVPNTAAGAASGDPKLRVAAQHGLDFLARSTAQWARANNCYGCHVQAVTLEGLAIGKRNQYEVPKQDFDAIVDSILHMSGGARGPQGLWHSGYPKTARIFGGAAFARYDQWLGPALRDDLYRAARQLLEYQLTDGSVHGDHESRPVTAGVMQSTYQAVQTWRQAYARSADQVWLPPIQRAERYLQNTAAQWKHGGKDVYLQDVNYALLGLISAGATAAEGTPKQLVQRLVAAQAQDGGWGFNGQSGQSDAFATGQTVAALRAAGMTDREGPVARGTAWLVAHQQRDGGWGASGSGKAEAMWAVQGLVSLDVLTLTLHGISDGGRVSGVVPLEVEARDNQGGAVSRVELFVDDVPLKSACAATLATRWDTALLKQGRHLVDAVATNARGQQSRRRFEVYAGNLFLTQFATRYEQGPEAGTRFSVRDIAEEGRAGVVRLAIFAADTSGKKTGAELHAKEQKSMPGALAFAWDGRGQDQKLKPRGRYLAEISFRDAQGRVLQTESALFVQDTEEARTARFGQVEGALAVRGAGAANTLVELVDDKGEVVQRTVTTEEGQYRFKDVDAGKYKVRVKKDGFAPMEAPAAAAPGKSSAMGVQSL